MTTPLLRPNQVEDFKAEIARITEVEQGPAFVRNSTDFPKMVKYKRELEAKLNDEAPRPLTGGDLDMAVGREAELRTKIAQGMPTQAEMRRNPPGAVDKHRKWESRNKQDIKEWKNLRLRLGASGALDDCLPDSIDVASVERFRPNGGPGEMNLDVAQIPGRDFHIPANPHSVVLTDEELSVLRTHAPSVYDKLATMPAEQRQAVKDTLDQHSVPRLNSGTLDRIPWPKVREMGRDFGIADIQTLSKEKLYGAILEGHSGEPVPEKYLEHLNAEHA